MGEIQEQLWHLGLRQYPAAYLTWEVRVHGFLARRGDISAGMWTGLARNRRAVFASTQESQELPSYRQHQFAYPYKRLLASCQQRL